MMNFFLHLSSAAIFMTNVSNLPYIEVFHCRLEIPPSYRIHATPTDEWGLTFYSDSEHLREHGELGSIKLTRHRKLKNEVSASGEYSYQFTKKSQLGDLELFKFQLLHVPTETVRLSALIIHDGQIMVRFEGHSRSLGMDFFEECGRTRQSGLD